MRPDPNDRDRPAANRTASNVTGADIHQITALAAEVEARRRVQLRRDLHRAADRLTPFDLPAAALARAWAREVA